MEKTYLFPAACKKIGLWLFIPFAVLGFCTVFDIWTPQWELPVPALIGTQGLGAASYFKMTMTDIMPTVIVFGLVTSLLLLCFSRERDEDEYVANLRCRTLIIAVIASYTALLVGDLLIYGMPFLTFLFINVFTVLLLYAAVFNYRLYKFRKSARDEE